MLNKYKEQLDIIEKKNPIYNFSLVTFKDKLNVSGILKNLTFAIKDNFNYKDTITTAGSLFFRDYISPYSATVVELLINSGASPICKTNMDEFGMGGTGLCSAFGSVLNPIDESRITGGSSSGSAVAVAIGACDFALGSDTGDSIRRPASYMGIIGFKPSYGVISRYGVFPYSPSLDHIGIFSKEMAIIYEVMSVIAKHDPKDFTSQLNEINFNKKFIFKKLNIAVIKEIIDTLKPNIKEIFLKKIQKLNKLNIKIVNYDLNLLKSVPLTYSAISYVEGISCYQNLSSIAFGPKFSENNLFKNLIKNRSENLGKEVKRRLVIGAHFLNEDNYERIFLKAAKMRTLFLKECKKIFDKHDLIISLASADIAPTIKSVLERKYNDGYADYFLQIGNFGGYPSITIPFISIDNNPIGINITGNINDDLKVLSCAEYIINNLNKVV
ncbi:MAG: amidase family protein [Mycoplasmoidaceae bacterium]